MRLLGVALVILTCLAGVAPPAEADGRRGHLRGDLHGSRRFDGHGHHHGHHRHHHHGFRGFRHRTVIPFFVGPSVVLASPFVATPAPVYAPPPVYVAPPVYAPPPVYPAPSVPRVVEFPTGRYELRGDGVYTPYTWVWIPNPPVAPPPPPEPTAPPPPRSAPEPRREPTRTTMLYRWTDEQGVTTWTDSIEKVPARHRAQAGRLAP
jgi:hypothetical protein